MAERKHISLIYQYNDNWIGGTYYILNIIKALKYLPDKDKPFLTIFYNQSHSNSLNDLINIDYPYIEYIQFFSELSLTSRIINRISRFLTGKAMIFAKLPLDKIVNLYYYTFNFNKSNIENYYCWIPDFQDLYLPHFFTENELKARADTYKQLVENKEKIVFSSEAALMDFNKFFPNNTNLKKIVRFTSSADSNFDTLLTENLKIKFDIKSKYFIVSNQFWRHKNHRIVLEAFNDICKSYSDYQLVLTGKEYDHREKSSSAYINELKNYVKEENLTDKILFLGFIDRNEQLKLMKESLAIIQPSLFEGWSTVIEDAKFLNKCIICSKIPVHEEQLPNHELFFEPSNKKSLIQIIEKVVNNEGTYNMGYNKSDAIIKFGYDFINIF